jgi:hypothetical protein
MTGNGVGAGSSFACIREVDDAIENSCAFAKTTERSEVPQQREALVSL